MMYARAVLWNDITKKYINERPIRGVGRTQRKKSFDYSVIYPYYKELLQMPDIKPWAFFAFIYTRFSYRQCNFNFRERIFCNGGHAFSF